MRTTKVVESVDIEAPREEVFSAVVNCDRRLQLSPLWGVGEIEDISPDFPREGSRYHVKLATEDDETEYDTVVTDFILNQKFAYRLTVKRQTRTTWTFQDVAKGTRLIYHEEFLVDESGEDEELVQPVRQIVCKWLDNIKRYAELRDGWSQRLVKWLLDRYFLKLKLDQRRAIIMILAWQGISFITFVFVAIGLAIVGLV